MNPWKTLKQDIIHENKFGYKFRVDEVITPAGTITKYAVLDGRESVSIVALTSNKEFIMVRQWRYPIEEMSIEIPAGIIDPGETQLESARKELLEEVGGISDEWKYLGEHWLANGVARLKGHVYLALNVVIGKSHQPLEEEMMSTELISVIEAYEMLKQGAFKDVRTQLGLLQSKEYIL